MKTWPVTQLPLFERKAMMLSGLGAPGSSDQDVLARAVAEQQILITFDKDFGELAFRSHLPATCGIVLFRIPAFSAAFISNFVVAAIESRQDWSGHFSVIEEHRIRMRVL